MFSLKSLVTIVASVALSGGLAIAAHPSARAKVQQALTTTGAAVGQAVVQVESAVESIRLEAAAGAEANASASGSTEAALPPSVTIVSNTEADTAAQAGTTAQGDSSAAANVGVSSAVDGQSSLAVDAAVQTEASLSASLGAESEAALTSDTGSTARKKVNGMLDKLTGLFGFTAPAGAGPASDAEAGVEK